MIFHTVFYHFHSEPIPYLFIQFYYTLKTAFFQHILKQSLNKSRLTVHLAHQIYSVLP